MKIRSKLFGGFFIVVAIGVFLGVVGFYSNTKFSSSSGDVLRLANTRTSIASILSSHYTWRHGLSQTVYAGTAFTGSLDSSACSLGKWLISDEVKNIVDSEVISLIKQVTEPHHFIHTKAGEIIDHLKKGENDEALKKFTEEVLPKTQEVISNLQKMDEREEVLLNNKIVEINEISLMFKRIITALIIVAIVVSVLLAVIITSNITKPIVKAVGVLEIVAEGDMTQSINIHTKDEIGELAHDLNLTVEKIGTLIGTIKYKINALTNTGHELSANMARTSKAVDQISEDFEGMKANMNKQEESAAEADNAVKHIKNNIDNLSKLIEDQSDSINTSSSA
ncbi:MAG: HAMP domain-containing protein, partial [Treponema sp.]|nr:HAMP domain-containing protein [Treponema sp.]